jgi:uncharacterized membrane protein YfcA
MSNLGLLAAVGSVLGVALAVYINDEFPQDAPFALLLVVQLFLWIGLLLPGALPYLVILERLPQPLSARSLRARAVALSPLLTAGPLLLSGLDGFFGDYFWVFLIPAVLLYGGIVRLPPRAQEGHTETTTLS